MRELIKKVAILINEHNLSGSDLEALIEATKKIEEAGYKVEAIPTLLPILTEERDNVSGFTLAHDLSLIATYIPKLAEANIKKELLVDMLKYNRVRKNMKYLLEITDNIISQREKLGLGSLEALVNHLRKSDPSGKSIGCGCVICRTRNETYYSEKILETHQKELKMLQSLERTLSLRNSSDIVKKVTIATDPFATNFLDRQNTVFIKTKLKINDTDSVVTKLSELEDLPLVFERIKRAQDSIRSKKAHYQARIDQRERALAQLIKLTFLPL